MKAVSRKMYDSKTWARSISQISALSAAAPANMIYGVFHVIWDGKHGQGKRVDLRRPHTRSDHDCVPLACSCTYSN